MAVPVLYDAQPLAALDLQAIISTQGLPATAVQEFGRIFPLGNSHMPPSSPFDGRCDSNTRPRLTITAAPKT